jgi:AraC-like DNA-binding protein
VAGTLVPWIINFGAPYRVFGGADTHDRGVARGSFVAGLYDTWAAVEAPTQSCALQVNFTPFAAWQLLRVPLSSLENRSEDATALLGPAGRVLEEQLGNATSWPARFALLDRFLCARLSAAPLVPAPVRWCWDVLESTGGRASIRTLAIQLGWSPRRLIAAFREHCGLPPRTIAGLRRFERTVARLDALVANAGPLSMRGRWSALALDGGYADQSHLNRDFVRFAGCTPTAYLRGRLASGGGVIDLGALAIVDD